MGGARVKPEAEETIPCVGFEGRVIGKGGVTINRLQQETGARINIVKGSGECVVTGSAEQVLNPKPYTLNPKLLTLNPKS
jgi:polyribonucleotide nucleotidyltransferase